MRPPKKGKLYYAKTADGWEIALHRYPGKESKYPVLLVHGLASNYANMDFPIEELSLAKYLFRQGFDTWVVDLRGSGLSRQNGSRSNHWCFDDYVFFDLPAAMDKVFQTTKAKQIHWLGHSMGGVLAMPLLQVYNVKNPLRSIVAVATPMDVKSKPGYFKYLYRLDGLFRLLPRLPYRYISRIAAMFPRTILQMQDHLLFARDNMTEEILKNMLNHAVENIPTRLILQMHDWFRHNYWGSQDRSVDYFQGFNELNMPVLMLVGSIDSFTPKEDLISAMRRIPAKKKSFMVFGKNKGHENEYGHIDLIIGKNAPKEVFPHISKWLWEHDR